MKLVAAFLLIAAACTPLDQVDGSRYEFDFGCDYAGSLNDDAIVYPDQPGASHLHDFFGVLMSGDMKRADLLASKTSCHGDGNWSAYWAPAAYDANGVQIIPVRLTGYYRSVGKWPTYSPHPDLRMVTDSVNEWGVNQDGLPYVELVFGDCSNGDPDSVDHRGHVVLSDRGVCPESHAWPIPRINIRIIYPEQPVSIASGNLDTAHADFFHGWDVDVLWESIDRCLNEGRDAAGNLDLCRSHH